MHSLLKSLIYIEQEQSWLFKYFWQFSMESLSAPKHPKSQIWTLKSELHLDTDNMSGMDPCGLWELRASTICDDGAWLCTGHSGSPSGSPAGLSVHSTCTATQPPGFRPTFPPVDASSDGDFPCSGLSLCSLLQLKLPLSVCNLHY